MVIIRATVRPSTFYFLLDPGGAFWPGRVNGWIEARAEQGPGYSPTGQPVITRLPARAVVYFTTTGSVTTAHLASLQKHWSDTTPYVEVEQLEIVDRIASEAEDRHALEGESLQARISSAIGTQISNAAWMLLIAGAVGIALYAVVKSGGGTKSWQ